MKKLLAPSLLLISLTSIAEDYSMCQNGPLFRRMNDKGEIVAAGDETITKKEKKDGYEKITFKNTLGYTSSILIRKDQQGRVIGVKDSVDWENLSKVQRDKLREEEGYRIAFGGFPGACSFGGTSTGLGDMILASSSSASRECASVSVYDPELKMYVPANYKMINKNNFKNFQFAGIKTWEEFQKMRAMDIKRWKVDAKVAKAYATGLDKLGWAFPAGQGMELKYNNDGSCYIDKVTDLKVNGKNGAKFEAPVFDSASCDRMEPVFKKWDEKLSECSANKIESHIEIMAANNNTPIQVGTMTGGKMEDGTEFSAILTEAGWQMSSGGFINQQNEFQKRRSYCNLYRSASYEWTRNQDQNNSNQGKAQ